MVRGGLAVVTDNLETANHLTDGEETQALGGNNTTGNELTVADVTGLLDKVLGSLEESAVLEGFPEGLVGVLEGGDGTMMPSMLELFEFLKYYNVKRCEILTEGSSSGPGRPAWRPRRQPWSSRRRRGFDLIIRVSIQTKLPDAITVNRADSNPMRSETNTHAQRSQ